jgi:hypothetical protein
MKGWAGPALFLAGHAGFKLVVWRCVSWVVVDDMAEHAHEAQRDRLDREGENVFRPQVSLMISARNRGV